MQLIELENMEMNDMYQEEELPLIEEEPGLQLHRTSTPQFVIYLQQFLQD